MKLHLTSFVLIIIYCFTYLPVIASSENALQESDKINIRQIIVKNATNSFNQFISNTTTEVTDYYRSKTDKVLGISIKETNFKENFDFSSIIGNIKDNLLENKD